LLQPKNKIVEHFGGAVLLKKDIVISTRNWNPSVVDNEEFDLYVRIQELVFFVYGLDIKMVKRIVKNISNVNTLSSFFYLLNKRFYSFGQSLVSQYRYWILWYSVKKDIIFLFIYDLIRNGIIIFYVLVR
jgi:hypothetical protein